MNGALPVAVLDSSVLVPLWSRVVLQQIAARSNAPFVPVWSEWTVAETWRVLAWRWCVAAPRLGVSERNLLAATANQMMRRLLPVMRLVTIRDYLGPEPWPGLQDPERRAHLGVRGGGQRPVRC